MRLLLFLAFVALQPAIGGAADDYILSVGGETFELSLGQAREIEIQNGQKVAVTVTRKDVVTYESRFFSFRHKSIYQPNQTDMGNGIRQTMMVTPSGTGVLMQEYEQLDPTSLVDLMLRELTKEEVIYGYTLKTEKAERTLDDGTVLRGKVATTTIDGEQWVRGVFAFGRGNRGVIAITMIERDSFDTEQSIIDSFWASLVLRDLES